ncbi:AraC family transcriptional regulator [Cohnella sp. LGH]|uniref:AraC family transcriptional regulator n=1 Tax=Cohnella sp. LGH TaxID=1619153 RepID=UPI001FFE0679|nr:AraC family transcriptional regulator [Cohnella sp. LGH]
MEELLKPDGFESELLLVLPEYMQRELADAELTRQLFVSDIGYFPRARYHYRERPEGCDAHIVLLCAEGEGEVVLTDSGVRMKLNARHLVVIPADTEHRYGASEHEPWSIYWFHVKGEHAAALIAQYELDRGPLPLPIGVYGGFVETFRHCYDMLAERAYAAGAHAHVSQAVRYLLSGIGIATESAARGRRKDSGLEKALRYMADHAAESVKLSELAKHAGVSKQHLIYLFKQETGFPPIEYFLRMKMQRAARLLDLTDLGVKQIAAAVGLSDPYYFSRLFKQMMGLSPTKYRQIPKG